MNKEELLRLYNEDLDTLLETASKYIKKDIENESVNKVVVNTKKQTESLKQYIDIQYRYLEGVGNHISQQDLFCEDNINLIHSIKEYSFHSFYVILY